MKQKYISLVVSFLLLSVPVCAREEQQSDLALYQELSAAYGAGFYPGVVSYAQTISAQYPDSVFTADVLIKEGESLVRLGRYEEADAVLAHAESITAGTKLPPAACRYWRGRSLYGCGKNVQAAAEFHGYLAAAGSGGQYYRDAVLYAGRACLNAGDYAQASLLFGTVVSNGNAYSPDVYGEAAAKLLASYNGTKQYQKTVALFTQFNKTDFSGAVYAVMTEYAGEAYEALGEYRKAYESYSAVLASGQKNLAGSALRRAYIVSSEHRAEVGEDSGTVLANAQSLLSDSPELVSEFWTRLAIDAYDAGDYQKADTYFVSAEKNATPEISRIASLYCAQMRAAGSGGSAADAEKILSTSAEQTSVLPGSADEQLYRTFLVRYAAMRQQWNDVLDYAAGIQKPDVQTIYYKACALYFTGKMRAAAELIAPYTANTAYQMLYARALLGAGNTEQALSVYRHMDESAQLSSVALLDYANVLLRTGAYASAFEVASRSREPLAPYVAGIAQFNGGNWESASDCFAALLRDQRDAVGASYRGNALFYKGYSEYRRGKNADAYADLTRYTADYQSGTLSFEAYAAAADAAVQSGSYPEAVVQAEYAVKCAPTEAAKERAVLLCSSIYADAKQYGKAIEVLREPSKTEGPFGMKCLYQTAQIYARAQDIDQADSAYASVAKRYHADPLAEEALYRRGELYFGVAKYGAAVSRFTAYTAAYPGGKFADAALFYTAECYEQTGSTDRAVLTAQLLVKQYPESTYIYGAEKDLIAWNRQRGDYTGALAAADVLLARYGAQAQKDGIAAQRTEIAKLASGADERIVAKQSEYEQAGGAATAEGRKAGTELASLYFDGGQYDNAEKTAALLLDRQEKAGVQEITYAAENADILAQCSRHRGAYRESAARYLTAAEKYRAGGQAERAAASLYGAVDSFVAAGMTGDAEDTATALKKMYPESRQAQTVDSLLGR